MSAVSAHDPALAEMDVSKLAVGIIKIQRYQPAYT